MIEQPKFEIAIGAINDQQDTVFETIPSLLPAALYADKVTVITAEDDTLIELPDYSEVSEALGMYGGGTGVIDTFGFDERFSNPNSSSERLNWEEIINGAYGLHENMSFKEEQEIIAIYEARGIMQTVNDMLQRPEVMPLIYDPNGRLAQNIYELGRIATKTKVKKQDDSVLGTELVMKLPSFQSLKPDEIVELRKRLASNLIPFRSFVAETSLGISEANNNEEALADVIHEIYIKKVVPTVNELELQVKDNAFLRRLLHDFGRDPKTFIQSFLTFGIGEAINLPLYATIGTAIGGHLIAEAAKMQAESKAIKNNRLYFLYEIERFGQEKKSKYKITNE